MKNLTLVCFKDFKCIANQCKHSCCFKWKIKIDKKSLRKYKKNKDGFFDKGVDYVNSEFILLGGRCSFLDSDNLCRIIKNYGNNAIPEICRLHPRFVNKYPFCREWGVGLSCEEGARKLVLYKDKIVMPKVIAFGFTKKLLKTREKIVNTLNYEIPFSKKLDCILDDLGVNKEKFYSFDFITLYQSTERLNKDYNLKLKNIDLKAEISQALNRPLSNIAIYFIYRYLTSSIDLLDLKSKILFSVLSALVIYSLSIKTTESIIDSAREYSSEIEYSMENLNKIWDITDFFVVQGQ